MKAYAFSPNVHHHGSNEIIPTLRSILHNQIRMLQHLKKAIQKLSDPLQVLSPVDGFGTCMPELVANVHESCM